MDFTRISEFCNINAEENSTITIIFDDVFGKRIREMTVKSDKMTLDDCRIFAKSQVLRGNIGHELTVLVRGPKHGAVYRYGEHGDFWEKCGTMSGYLKQDEETVSGWRKMG